MGQKTSPLLVFTMLGLVLLVFGLAMALFVLKRRLGRKEERLRKITEDSLKNESRSRDMIFMRTMKRYQELFNHMTHSVVVYITRDNGETFQVEDINATLKADFQLETEDFIGRDMMDIFPGVVDSGVTDAVRRVYRTGDSLSLPEVYYQDDVWDIWLKLNIYKLPFGEIVIVGENISERKKAQDALNKSEAMYRKLFNSSPFGIRVLDQFGKILFCNPALHKIYNDHEGKLIGQYSWSLAADDRQMQRAKFYYDTPVDQRQEPKTVFTKHKTMDGKVIDVHLNGDCLYDSEGRFEHIISTVNDVTSLRKLESQLQSVINSIGDPLYIAGSDYLIEFQNTVSMKQSGDLVGKVCYESLFFQDSPCEFCRLNEALADQCIKIAESSRINNCFYEITFSPYTGSGDDLKSVVVYRDVTEKKQLLAEAMRSSHLASLGELAASVAHEINNPATGIICISEVLMDKFERLGGDRNIPERIINEAERISRIVQNLLAFARKGNDAHVLTDLNRVVALSLELTEKQIYKDRIHLDVDLQNDLPRVMANAQELQQVVLNLISNACYSLNEKYPRGGGGKRLEISTHATMHDPGPRVCLSISDTGLGIPEKMRGKIVEPFFSTKPRGKGTGLGLSICHGIVVNHGGELRIHSVEGEHATVTVDMPVAGPQSMTRDPNYPGGGYDTDHTYCG